MAIVAVVLAVSRPSSAAASESTASPALYQAWLAKDGHASHVARFEAELKRRKLDGIANHAIVRGLTYEDLEVTGEASAPNAYIPNPPGEIAAEVQSDLIETDIKAAEIAERLVGDRNRRPEHLELSVQEPQAWLPKLANAGAVFLGRWSSEAIGDYCAGPNHVLPTGGSARFSSPLGVYDFQKRSSVIAVSQSAAASLGRISALLAEGEGLSAHARSAEMRFKK